MNKKRRYIFASANKNTFPVMTEKLYRYIFWSGYGAVLITAFLPLSINVDKIKFGPDIFEIRLDHMLHFGAYFLISMYYLYGKIKGLRLFRKESIFSFLAVTIFLATITEVVQIWVPVRSFNVFDGVANVTGLLAGLAVVRLFLKRRQILGLRD